MVSVSPRTDRQWLGSSFQAFRALPLRYSASPISLVCQSVDQQKCPNDLQRIARLSALPTLRSRLLIDLDPALKAQHRSADQDASFVPFIPPQYSWHNPSIGADY